jgi:hypothetical protein
MGVTSGRYVGAFILQFMGARTVIAIPPWRAAIPRVLPHGALFKQWLARMPYGTIANVYIH